MPIGRLYSENCYYHGHSKIRTATTGPVFNNNYMYVYMNLENKKDTSIIRTLFHGPKGVQVPLVYGMYCPPPGFGLQLTQLQDTSVIHTLTVKISLIMYVKYWYHAASNGYSQ